MLKNCTLQLKTHLGIIFKSIHNDYRFTYKTDWLKLAIVKQVIEENPHSMNSNMINSDFRFYQFEEFALMSKINFSKLGGGVGREGWRGDGAHLAVLSVTLCSVFKVPPCITLEIMQCWNLKLGLLNLKHSALLAISQAYILILCKPVYLNFIFIFLKIYCIDLNVGLTH